MIDTRISLEQLNARNFNTLVGHVGIEFVEINADYLVARMPVDQRTTQPLGLLHGGASAVLAETVGSIAGYLSVDRDLYYTVGLEIKCNHVKAVTSGFVYGTAKPAHLGTKTQVWVIEIKDEENNLVCLSTHTIAILEITEKMKLQFKDLFYRP